MIKKLILKKTHVTRYNKFLVSKVNALIKGSGKKISVKDELPSSILQFMSINITKLNEEELISFLDSLVQAIISGLYLQIDPYNDFYIDQEEKIIIGFIQQNTLLIKNVTDKTRLDISRVVRDGIHIGTSNQEISRQINEVLSSSRNRCRTIAVTETAKVHGQLNRNRMNALGIEEGIWYSANLRNTRKCHRVRNGKTFKISEGLYSACDGKYLQIGGEINCRCGMAIKVY